MRVKLMVVCLLLLIIPSLGAASEYAAYKKDMMKPYGLYKKSLALTSKKKNQDKAIVVVQKFISSWKEFAKIYANDVPDKLNGTVDFTSRIKRPVTVGEEALAMLKKGEVKKAHSHIEEIRYSLWRMRVDAGVASLNDKINDFHEAMEIVIDGISEDSSPEHLQHLGSRYGQWLSIKWADVEMADESVVDKKAFANTISDGHKAIIKLLDILHTGNAADAKKAAGMVKKSYKAVFFLPECS